MPLWGLLVRLDTLNVRDVGRVVSGQWERCVVLESRIIFVPFALCLALVVGGCASTSDPMGVDDPLEPALYSDEAGFFETPDIDVATEDEEVPSHVAVLIVDEPGSSEALPVRLPQPVEEAEPPVETVEETEQPVDVVEKEDSVEEDNGVGVAYLGYGKDLRAVLRPGLVVKVAVFVAGKEEISETRRIADNGFLSLPLVGRFMARGMAIDELAQALEARYAESFFVNPTVEVSFVMDDNKGNASPWGFITVLGRVKEPGRVGMPATQDMTLTLALQLAGGFDTSAKQSAVRITRQVDHGEKRTFKVDLDRVGAKGRGEEDIMLRPGDVVYVPETIF